MKKLLILGDYGSEGFHRFEGADQVLADTLSGDFEVTLCADYAGLTYDDLRQYALVISYCNEQWCDKTSQDLVAAILTYVVNGGCFLPLHFGGCLAKSLRTSPFERGGKQYELCTLIGGRFTMQHPPYTVLEIYPVGDHPANRGAVPFTIEEEPYVFDMGVFGDRTVLYEYKYGSKTIPAFWFDRFGKGLGAYLFIGHDRYILSNENVKRMIRSFAVWAAGRSEEE